MGEEEFYNLAPDNHLDHRKALQFVLSIPGVSYVTAWNIVAVGGFTTIKEIVDAGMDDFVARVPNLTRGKATKIMDHFTRVYEGGARADCKEVPRPEAIFDWQ